MKKLILWTLLGSVTTLANAVPNVWDSYLRQGGYNIFISTANNDKLDLGCYLSDEPKWHNLTVTYKGKEIVNDDKKHPLSFFIDNKYSYSPSLRMQTSDDGWNWNQFIEKLPTAKKIEVYNNNKLLFILNPRNGGDEISEIQVCTLQ